MVTNIEASHLDYLDDVLCPINRQGPWTCLRSHVSMTVLSVARLGDDLFGARLRLWGGGDLCLAPSLNLPPILSRSALSFLLYNPILHIPSQHGDIRWSPLGPKDLEADQVRKLSERVGSFRANLDLDSPSKRRRG
jgi:hypothetical protein